MDGMVLPDIAISEVDVHAGANQQRAASALLLNTNRHRTQIPKEKTINTSDLLIQTRFSPAIQAGKHKPTYFSLKVIS
jgi:hypothetical protein